MVWYGSRSLGSWTGHSSSSCRDGDLRTPPHAPLPMPPLLPPPFPITYCMAGAATWAHGLPSSRHLRAPYGTWRDGGHTRILHATARRWRPGVTRAHGLTISPLLQDGTSCGRGHACLAAHCTLPLLLRFSGHSGTNARATTFPTLRRARCSTAWQPARRSSRTNIDNRWLCGRLLYGVATWRTLSVKLSPPAGRRWRAENLTTVPFLLARRAAAVYSHYRQR